VAAKSKKSQLLQRAIELYNQDYKLNAISRELDIHSSTLRRWFRKEGIEAKTNPHGSNPREDDPDPLKTAVDKNLEDITAESIKVASHDARLAEDKTMMDIAEAQSSPADKYQSYVAAAGIKLLRDSMKNLRGPRTVKELSELDQLIRRNLGLNSRTGGGQSKMQIDISILNDTKADRGKGALKVKPKKVIEVEAIEEPDDV
jgi:transposase-like protein